MAVYQVDFHASFANFDMGPSFGPVNSYKYPPIAPTNNTLTHNGITYFFSASSTASGVAPYRIMDLTNTSWGSQNRYSATGTYTGTVTTNLPSNPAYLGEYVQVQLSTPLAYTMFQFQRTTGGGQLLRYPVSYALVASNDQINWTELTVVDNENATVGSIELVPNVGLALVNFYPTNIGYFQYYRFITNQITPGGETSYPAWVRELRAYASYILPSPFILSFRLPFHYHYSHLPIFLKSIGGYAVGPHLKPSQFKIKLKNVANENQVEPITYLSQSKSRDALRQHFVDIYLGHVTGNYLEGTIELLNSHGYIELYQQLSLVFFIDSEYM